MPMRPTCGTRLGFGCPTADSEQTGSPTVLAAAIRSAAATACGDVTQVVVPGPLPVTVGAGVVGPGVCEGRGVSGGGLGRVVVGDGGGGGALGRIVVRDGGGGALGRVVVGAGGGGGELGPCGVADGLGVGVWGGAGFVVGVCAGGVCTGGVCTGGGTGVVRWGAGRVAVGTGGTVRVGLGAGVRVGFGVDGAGELGADGRGVKDGDGDGLGVDADGVTTADGVGCEALPPWPDDRSAQAARPPPRATTAAPPAIHGAFRDGRRCRFMILTVHPIADGLKPKPGRSRAGTKPPPAPADRPPVPCSRPRTDALRARGARDPARLAAPTMTKGGPVGVRGSPLREGVSARVTSVKRAPSCWRWLPLCGSLCP